MQIVTREFMLDLMRRLQKGERILSQEALEEEHEECLKAHNCFVSIVDVRVCVCVCACVCVCVCA